MSTRNDYNADEWEAISAAPVAAGLLMALSDTVHPRPMETATVVVNQAITRSTFGDAPEIAKVLADNTRRRDGCIEVPEMADPPRNREMLVGIVSVAVSAVGAKSPAELEPFKAWLAAVAARVFHTAKLADVPAAGEPPLTRGEQDSIDRLAGVLGVCDAWRPGSLSPSIPASQIRTAPPSAAVTLGPVPGEPAAAHWRAPGAASWRARPSV